MSHARPLFVLAAATACTTAGRRDAARTAREAAPRVPATTAGAADTAAVRAAAGVHYGASDSVVARAVTIRADTAWATVHHGRVSWTVVRLERRGGRWHFAREAGYGIR
jgi:hypothetical protein